jgi:hypothetical protein
MSEGPRALSRRFLALAAGWLLASGSTDALAQARLIISEFRLRGPSGASDEFVEIYNDGDEAFTVEAADGSEGFALVPSDGVARFIIPNGTVIPARGHFLGVNSVAYSLGNYPAGSRTTATGDATFSVDIPDNAGITLFGTSTPANFTTGYKLDAVGSTSEANTLYKEGTGYPALTPFSIDHSFYRTYPMTGFIPPAGCGVAATAALQDSDSNAADFVFVDTNGTSAGAGQRLGSPGPENLSSPVNQHALPGISSWVFDPEVGPGEEPNFVRDYTSDPAENSTFGSVMVRRMIYNNTGAALTALRLRVWGISTFPAPLGVADLRMRSVNDYLVPLGDREIVVHGTSFEEPPNQPNGGAFNGSLAVNGVSVDTPLAPGASIPVQLRFGLQQTGNFQLFVTIEALPTGGASVWGLTGNSDNMRHTDCIPGTGVALSSDSPALVGQDVTLTATVSAASGTPTGDVVFRDGHVELGTAPLEGATATLVSDSLALGSHSLVALYQGDGEYAPSMSSPFEVVIEGEGGAGGAGTGAGGSGAGGAEAGNPAEGESGCSCRSAHGARSDLFGPIAVALLACWGVRRRRRP